VTDRPPYPDTSGDADREPTTGTPRWVKVFGIIALVVILLFVVVLLTRGPGGRGHGPARHTPFWGTLSSGVAEPGGAGGHDPAEQGH